MTTKVILAERCQLYLGGGVRPDGQKVHLYELERAVESVANKLLRMDYAQSNMPMGETIPNGAATATYDNIPVYKYKNVSACNLPGLPVRLPLNQGVRIFASNDVTCEYIPLQKGDLSYLASQPLLSDLLGFTGYEVDGTLVVFNKDISSTTQTPNVVLIKLIVLDITQYGDYDLLPITSEQEWDIFSQVVKMYGVEPPADKIAQPTIAAPQTGAQA